MSDPAQHILTWQCGKDEDKKSVRLSRSATKGASSKICARRPAAYSFGRGSR